MSKSTFKILFYVRKNYVNRSGKAAIMIRITIDGKMVQISSKQEIEPHLWDTARGRASGRGVEATQVNSVLDNIQATLLKHYRDIERREDLVTVDKLKNAFLGIDESQDTLLQYFDRHNQDTKKLIGISKTNSTFKKYDLARRRVADFMKYRYNISDIALRELNLNFIRDYDVYLRSECKLCNNVTAKMIQYLKKIVLLAFNNGVIRANPFGNYHIKMHRVDIGYLTKEELEIMMSKHIEIKRLDIIRDVFVFCCWTGLSYIDVRNLKKEHIKESDGKLWIMTKRQKTGNPVNVLLLDVPKQIIRKYQNNHAGELLFPVLSNQKMNSYLKELADICSLKKNLTFHMSRHTFATTTTLSNGVPIETVSKMLGHSNLKTTQIYARVTNTKISDDMQLLESKLRSTSERYKG